MAAQLEWQILVCIQCLRQMSREAGGLKRGGDAKQLESDARQLKWSGVMSSPRTFLLCAPAELSPLLALHFFTVSELHQSSRCRRVRETIQNSLCYYPPIKTFHEFILQLSLTSSRRGRRRRRRRALRCRRRRWRRWRRSCPRSRLLHRRRP